MLKKQILLATLILSFVCIGNLFAAETIDWQRYCIDGMQLSGNHAVRYRNADAIPITVVGKSQAEADTLLDENTGTFISWSSGQ